MATYKTQQKEMLLDFLKRYPDKPFSVEEIVSGLEKEYEDAPGKSTVYRLVAQLVESGSIRRFVKGNSRQFLYQLTGDEECHHHLHLKCTECGKLLHMGHELSEKVLMNILGENDFTVEADRTTLFGCCKECKTKGELI